jgi:PAS domain S-box-containing protein
MSTDPKSIVEAGSLTHVQAESFDNARYQTLANEVTAALYSCDPSGVINYYNNQAAELWGRRPEIGDTDERFCGSHMLYRKDGSYLPHDQCPMADVLAGKVSGVYDAEVHIERPDGSRVIVIVNIAPLIDEEGQIVGAINSFCDIKQTKFREPARERQLVK